MGLEDSAARVAPRRAAPAGRRAQVAASCALLATGAGAGLVLLETGTREGSATVALIMLAAMLSGVQGLNSD